MTPAPTPETSLADLTRLLGHRKAQVREAAARELHDRGSLGLEALLDAWDQVEKQEERRGVFGIAILSVGLIAGLCASFAQTNEIGGVVCFVALFVGFAGGILYTTPSRLQRALAGALSEYDGPRVLRPLAQSLRMLTSDDPRRAQVLARLQQELQEQPDHEVYFPKTKKVLRWQPELAHRPIRLFWFWLTLTLFMEPFFVTVYSFFLAGWSHTSSVVGTGFAMPLVYTLLAGIQKKRLREDITYTRRADSTRQPWRFIVGTGVVIALTGVVTHLIRGQHPSWPQIAWASIGVPVCWWLASLAGKRALPEPPDKQL